MNNDSIIVRLRSSIGLNRISISRIKTLANLKQQITKLIKLKPNDFTISYQDKRQIKDNQRTQLYNLRQFKDGVFLIVNQSSNAFRQRQEKEKKLKQQLEKKAKIKQQNQNKVNKCNHPPTNKCINCMSTKNIDVNQINQKWMCQHGANAKCPHCLDKQFIKDTKHISFDNYLQQNKLKCKGVHPPQSKCTNCLPPAAVLKNCTNHAPFPKAMCNKCLPPNIMIKRQQYRHVDFAQFMNVKQLSNFVKYWVDNKMAIKRFGWVYGYYAQDPNYKGGIRAIVQAIYQPPQKNYQNDFQLLKDPDQHKVQYIASSLNIQKIGWLITDTNQDTFLSSKDIRTACRLQQQYSVKHSSGISVSKFITIVMRADVKGQVQPEVYMISDQGQTLQRQNLYCDSTNRKMMKIRKPINDQDIIPTVICQGKIVTQFQNDFLLVNVAHGSSDNKFAIVKNSDFPVQNRKVPAKKSDLKNYLQNYKGKPSYVRYGNFHLLIYLANNIDIQVNYYNKTICHIAQEVQKQNVIQSHNEQIVQSYATL